MQFHREQRAHLQTALLHLCCRAGPDKLISVSYLRQRFNFI